jgi:hypothetical protein
MVLSQRLQRLHCSCPGCSVFQGSGMVRQATRIGWCGRSCFSYKVHLVGLLDSWLLF